MWQMIYAPNAVYCEEYLRAHDIREPRKLLLMDAQEVEVATTKAPYMLRRAQGTARNSLLSATAESNLVKDRRPACGRECAKY